MRGDGGDVPDSSLRPRYAVLSGVLSSCDMYRMYDFFESRRAFLKPIDICKVEVEVGGAGCEEKKRNEGELKELRRMKGMKGI